MVIIVILIEITIDKVALGENGFNYEKSITLLCDTFERSGFIKDESNTKVLTFKGLNSNHEEEFIYLKPVIDYLFGEEWFTRSMDTFYISYYEKGKLIKKENWAVRYIMRYAKSIYDI